MHERTLRAINQSLPPLGIGCWQLGGRGWGQATRGSLRAALERALAGGVRLFDTAGVYGFGASERALGNVLRGRCEETVVLSKGGLVWDAWRRVRHDNRPSVLRQQIEDSLRRLQRDALEVFLLHWPDPKTPLAESADALEGLREDGLIRSWGVSNFSAHEVAQLAEQRELADPLVLEVPLNLLATDTEGRPLEESRRLLTEATQRGWDVIAFDVLARGLLAGGYEASTCFGKRDVRRRDARFQEPHRSRHLRRVELLRGIARQLNTSPTAVALRAALDAPGVTVALAGAKSPEQVDDQLEALELHLPSPHKEQLAGWLLPGSETDPDESVVG